MFHSQVSLVCERLVNNVVLIFVSVCKRGLTGHTTPTVRAICKFAVFQFRSLDLFCRFTLVMKALGIVL